jgi:pyruvate dehydrogenase E2 component (dihydrolipoamide acetyltransferase)
MRPQSSKPSSPGGRAVPIEMPRLSSEEGTATLSAWLVAVGDRVDKGSLIAELETDKATVELEAPVEGQIEALVVAAGTEGLKPGALLGRIVPTASVVETPAIRAVKAPVAAPVDVPAALAQDEISRSPATPLARRLAQVQGIDLERVTGTGVGGRVVQADIERSARGSGAGSGPALETAVTEEQPTESPQRSPQRRGSSPPRATARVVDADAPRPSAHLNLRCAMDAIVVARARLNEDLAARQHAARITLNDFIVRAAALALRDVPAANLRRAGDGVEVAPGVDVALVVATEAGPRTPVVRDADRKGLAVLSEEIRTLVAAARSGAAPAQSETDSTLAITSFARFGIESAYPMLPRDQICVLGVGTVLEQPVVRSGALAVGWTLSLTLAFDPAAIGGASAAELLGALRRHLEDPLSMML